MTQMQGQRDSNVGDALNNARHLLRSNPNAAAQQARAIINAEPSIAETYLILAAALRQLGNGEEAEWAESEAIRVSTADPVLVRARQLIKEDRLDEAEQLVQRCLQDTPSDPEALRLLAVIAMATGQLERAERLLWHTLSLAPNFDEAKSDFDRLIEAQSRAYPNTFDRAASPPGGATQFAEAIQLNENSLQQRPEDPKLWLNYGHILRIAGRFADSVEAYRKAIKLDASYGEAWWSLADLKTAIIDDADICLLKGQLGSEAISEPDRSAMHFVLGKAWGDAGDHAKSFSEYAAGNALRRKSIRPDLAATRHFVQEVEEVCSANYFAARSRVGHMATDPIFIVGMPRSGSTLVEQILASHPSIEGTEELPYIGNMAALIAGGRKAGLEASPLIENLAKLSHDKLRNFGGAYLWNADKHRHSNRPRFIDKMPRNWLYLPLIKLALPNAKIIDVRRNPMDCCWSNFRQLFADSGEFSYDLAELGDYYRSYVRMLAHFDRVLPGMVHRVIYEDLVTDTDREIRRLLDYLELPFDAACLEFHKNPRAVKTSSSEQVRQPITDAGIDQWRPYDTWLGPLKEALGTVLHCYPNVPENWN